jgi:Zn-dependent peptidase ImmA (M78 family)
VPGSATDPEKDSAQVLEQVWQPVGPDMALPVDPIQIARDLGIQVYVADLPEDESGRLLNRPGIDPQVYLNERDSRNRQRFTCAHEIGHYIRRVAAGDEKFSFRDKRDLVSSQGRDPEEIYANKFAAALLMPADLVKLHFAATPNPAILAHRFGVSTDAMNFRLVNLGLRSS